MSTTETDADRELVETEEPARTYEEDDPGDSAPDIVIDTDSALFVARRYEIVPRFEGRGVQRLEVSLSGTVELNLRDEADVALFRSLSLGEDVALSITGKVVSRPHSIKMERDGDDLVEVTVSAAKVKVHSLVVGADE